MSNRFSGCWSGANGVLRVASHALLGCLIERNTHQFGVAAGEDAVSGEGGMRPSVADDFGAGLFEMALGVEAGGDLFASELPPNLGRRFSGLTQGRSSATFRHSLICCKLAAEMRPSVRRIVR